MAKKSLTKFEGLSRAVTDFFDFWYPRFWEKWIADLPSRWTIVRAKYGDYAGDIFSLLYE